MHNYQSLSEKLKAKDKTQSNVPNIELIEKEPIKKEKIVNVRFKNQKSSQIKNMKIEVKNSKFTAKILLKSILFDLNFLDSLFFFEIIKILI